MTTKAECHLTLKLQSAEPKRSGRKKNTRNEGLWERTMKCVRKKKEVEQKVRGEDKSQYV